MQSAEGIMLALLLSSPLIILATHMVLSRLLRGSRPPQSVAVKALLLAYVPMGALLWYFSLQTMQDGLLYAAVFCAFVYSSIAYTYFHFFNMSETARRIRILFEIHSAGSLPGVKITELYSTEGIVQMRLKRLVETNQLKLTDGMYSVDNRVLYAAAQFIAFWRRLLGLG